MKKIITIFLGVCISIFFVSCSTPYYNQNSDLPNANNTKDFIHYEVEFDIPNEYTAYSTDNEFYTELIINDNIDVRKFKEENDNTDCDVYFTDENGKTYQSLNDSTHYFGAELEQHVLQDANGNSVTVTETTNGDYYYMDDNGTGYIDNGDGSWSDENGNSYTE